MAGANKSEVFVNIPGIGHAFITGVKDKCEHKYTDTVFLLANGGHIEAKKHMCTTWEATQEHCQYLAEQLGTTINGCTSQCCRCGKIYTMGDAIWDSYEYETNQ